MSEQQNLEKRIQELEAIEQEYKQMKALVESAAKGENLEKYAADMMLYVDPATEAIVNANDLALEFLGYSLEEIRVLKISQIERCENVQATIYNKSANPVENYDCHYRHQSGAELPVSVRKRLIEKADKTFCYYILEDKSLRKQLWRELSRREDSDFQFREQLKTLNEIILELGRIHSFADLCRRSIELGMERLGFDRMSIWIMDNSTKRMQGTFGVDEHGRIRDEQGQSWSYIRSYVEEFLAGKYQPIVTHDDAFLYNERSEIIGYGWHISVPLLDGTNFIGVMAVDNFLQKRLLKSFQTDLLQHFGVSIGHLLARQLEQENIRRLSRAVQDSASMIIILNKQGQVEFTNDAFSELTGYALSDVLGQNIASLFENSLILHSVSIGQDWQGEVRNHKKNGEAYDAFVSVSAVRLGDVLEHYVIVMEDISALKQAQQKALDLQLEQERVQFLEDFVSSIAHEFKTPLAIIKTSSYFLSKSSDEEKRQSHAEKIADSVAYLNHLLTVMLEMLRLDSQTELKLATLQLDSFLSDLMTHFSPIAEARQIQAKIQIHSKKSVQADARQLWRAMEEIIKNAIDYSSPSGTIEISLTESENQLRIRVQDTGIGIPVHDIDKIFERFYRVDHSRSSRNAGLGLAIARRIIELHHGEIRIESTLGHGSVFEINLPLSD